METCGSNFIATDWDGVFLLNWNRKSILQGRSLTPEGSVPDSSLCKMKTPLKWMVFIQQSVFLDYLWIHLDLFCHQNPSDVSLCSSEQWRSPTVRHPSITSLSCKNICSSFCTSMETVSIHSSSPVPLKTRTRSNVKWRRFCSGSGLIPQELTWISLVPVNISFRPLNTRRTR